MYLSDVLAPETFLCTTQNLLVYVWMHMLCHRYVDVCRNLYTYIQLYSGRYLFICTYKYTCTYARNSGQNGSQKSATLVVHVALSSSRDIRKSPDERVKVEERRTVVRNRVVSLRTESSNGLWPMNHAGVLQGYGICPKFWGSFGPDVTQNPGLREPGSDPELKDRMSFING